MAIRTPVPIAGLPPHDTDIYADPLSSSEDEYSGAAEPSLSSSTFLPSPAISQQAASKRPRVGAYSAIPRKRLRVDETKETTISQPPPSSILNMNNEWDVLVSSSSQGRKRKAMYGNQKMSSMGASDGFYCPPEVRKLAMKSVSPEFVPVGEVPEKISPHSKRDFERLDIPELFSDGEKSLPDDSCSNIPAEIQPEPSSASTNNSRLFPTFELPELPTEAKVIRRSTSATSLSSIQSLDLPEEYKSALIASSTTNDKPLTPATPVCPLCSAPVSQALLEEFNLGRRMKIHAQQRFCREHKRLDAIASLNYQGYPSQINWKELETVRIPKHVYHLHKVVARKVPSHYLRKLEEAADAPPNARKAVQKYLKEGFLNVVKPGYYGPKGQRIMTQEITRSMASVLRQALKRDKIMRMAEVGGYVSAVLVPELTLRLVLEDQGLPEDKLEAGLQILEASTQLGVDLWGLEDEQDEKVVLTENS